MQNGTLECAEESVGSDETCPSTAVITVEPNAIRAEREEKREEDIICTNAAESSAQFRSTDVEIRQEENIDREESTSIDFTDEIFVDEKADESQVIELNAIICAEIPENPILVIESQTQKHLSKNGILFVIGTYETSCRRPSLLEISKSSQQHEEFRNQLEQLLLERKAAMPANIETTLTGDSSFDDSLRADGSSSIESADNEAAQQEELNENRESPTNVEISHDDTEPNCRVKSEKRVEVFDTVRKQKQKFENVLKAINPNVRSSLRRAESSAPNEFNYKF